MWLIARFGRAVHHKLLMLAIGKGNNWLIGRVIYSIEGGRADHRSAFDRRGTGILNGRRHRYGARPLAWRGVWDHPPVSSSQVITARSMRAIGVDISATTDAEHER